MRRLRLSVCGAIVFGVLAWMALPVRAGQFGTTFAAPDTGCYVTATPTSCWNIHFVAQVTSCPTCNAYTWDFGDGSAPGAGLVVDHDYESAGAGNYYCTFSAYEYEILQCAASGYISVPNPEVACTATVPASGQVGQPVSFKASATDTCTETLYYQWGFGDGTTSSDQNATHTYAQAGTFTWSLAVSGSLVPTQVLCWGTHTITITAPSCLLSCAAGASPASGEAPLAVQFTGSATPSSGCTGSVTYDWDFGDGSSHSSAQSPSHTYTNPNTYNWTFVASLGQTQCRQTGSVVVSGTPAALSGIVAITDGHSTYLLDGPDVLNGWVQASQNGQEVAQTPIIGGTFAFAQGSLPDGTYALTAKFDYNDHITVDASNPDWGDYGCPAPAGGVLPKSVVSIAVSASVPSTHGVAVTFPPPIVMLHGMLECYDTFYSSDPSDRMYWDNDARGKGFLSFTPNYGWWGNETWNHRAADVMSQVKADLSGLTQGSAPPWSLVGFEMGGLVARVIGYEFQYADDYKALVKSLGPVFIMGTPNSGSDLLAGGGAGPLSEQEIVIHFNAAYPDFGSKNGALYAIAGNNGWWKLLDSDGRVSLTSAFVIEQVGCSDSATNPMCIPYASRIFDSGPGHIFFHTHYDLGYPATTQDILEGVILPGIPGFTGAFATGQAASMPIKPKSPGGSTIWGTTGRTTGTVSGTLTSFSGESGPASYPFPVSPTDGMAVLVYVKSGSATWQLVTPTGQTVALSADLTYFETNPACGQWTLNVTPGTSGVSFMAAFVEDGAFGILGYPAQDHYAPSTQAILRMDLTGDLTAVTIATVSVTVYDPTTGQVIATVPLYDDGNHGDGGAGDGSYGGYYTVPSSPASYPLAFNATGSYAGQDCGFSRVVFGSLNVLPASHLFTGHFTDAPVSLTSQTSYDGLLFKPTISFPRAGSYVVTASLYDSKGNYLDTATDTLSMTAAGSADAKLFFSLAKSYCSQYGKPFAVGDLEIDNAATMQPLDVWGADVATATYTSSGFTCQPGTPQPVVKAVHPDQGALGQALVVTVGGHDFKGGATLSLGAGVDVSQVSVIDRNLLVASVAVSETAQVGARTATVTNTDGTTATLPAAFTVSTDQPPTVKVLAPADFSTLTGDSLTASASATDDTRVTKVEFYLDSVLAGQATQFPFVATLDATSLANGAHTIAAKAYDDKGLSSDDSVTVYKNPPVISSVTSGGSPFKIKVNGSDFEKGAQVYIGSDATPWATAVVKSASLIVLKGGKSLKTRFPSGATVAIRIVNPDGGVGGGTYTRP